MPVPGLGYMWVLCCTSVEEQRAVDKVTDSTHLHTLLQPDFIEPNPIRQICDTKQYLDRCHFAEAVVSSNGAHQTKTQNPSRPDAGAVLSRLACWRSKGHTKHPKQFLFICDINCSYVGDRYEQESTVGAVQYSTAKYSTARYHSRGELGWMQDGLVRYRRDLLYDTVPNVLQQHWSSPQGIT